MADAADAMRRGRGKGGASADEGPRLPSHEQPDAAARRYYEDQAEHYAQLTQSRDLRMLWEPFERHLPAYARILDVGCGAGRDLRRFRQSGYHSIGIDRSVALATIAAAYAECPVVIADACALPVSSASVDATWCIATLLHVPRAKVQLALRELARTLRPGGQLFTSMKAGIGDSRDALGRLIVRYAPQDWHALVTGAGFEVVEMTVGVELRPGDQGQTEEVSWVNCWAVRRP